MVWKRLPTEKNDKNWKNAVFWCFKTTLCCCWLVLLVLQGIVTMPLMCLSIIWRHNVKNTVLCMWNVNFIWFFVIFVEVDDCFECLDFWTYLIIAPLPHGGEGVFEQNFLFFKNQNSMKDTDFQQNIEKLRDFSTIVRGSNFLIKI